MDIVRYIFVYRDRSTKIKDVEEGVLVKEVNKSATPVGSVQLPKGPAYLYNQYTKREHQQSVLLTRMLGPDPMAMYYRLMSCGGGWKTMVSRQNMSVRHARGVSMVEGRC